uniref:Uncharacterized protein n=1 Tax=Candidatus Kentrum eta TaxID=2126337 RepID=A0A450VBT4_9GAMM|nr:MAG: hypothetical protein BECKH772C_GA0070978_100861 [Candidatus Kentron sp. H]
MVIHARWISWEYNDYQGLVDKLRTNRAASPGEERRPLALAGSRVGGPTIDPAPFRPKGPSAHGVRFP